MNYEQINEILAVSNCLWNKIRLLPFSAQTHKLFNEFADSLCTDMAEQWHYTNIESKDLTTILFGEEDGGIIIYEDLGGIDREVTIIEVGNNKKEVDNYE